MMKRITENLALVHNRMSAAAGRAGRNPGSIRLVAVTKTVPVDKIRAAAEAGAGILGENRVQEAKEKIEQLGPIASWHLIGRLQTNKAKYAVKLFDLIHSVDNLDLAREIDKQAAKSGKKQDILIEVNVAGEASKAGMPVSRAASFAREAAGLAHISIKGLMTIPPFFDDPERARPCFSSLRLLAEKIASEEIPGVLMNELSMGMSGDFEVAIEEGATLVRVGTAIFGQR